jgi:predicted O-linked N-acetylglucosamine transferase (SPINDLY family)
MPTLPVSQAFALALEHQRADRLGEAEALYRQVLLKEPNHADALHHLGIIAHQMSRGELALDLIGRAAVLAPHNASIHFNLGEIRRKSGQLEEAVGHYGRAAELQPDFTQAHFHLGHIRRRQKRFDEAAAAYRQGLTLEPNHAGAQFYLGEILRGQGRIEEAIAAYQQALAIKPDFAEAWNSLGGALTLRQQFDEAVTAFRQALGVRADYAEACNNLAGVLARLAQVEEATALYQRAIALCPGEPAFLSNLLLILPLRPSVDECALHEEQLRWNRLYAEPLRSARRPHSNRPDPERRLKIGYVSADFRSHPLAFFLAPVLEAHDRRTCEIHCYAGVAQPDAVTKRLRQAADAWHDVPAMSDADLAEQIRAEEIDILIDLGMHSADNRLLTFARKPASIQVSWLAYARTTGLETIDYRLTDAFIEPPGGIDSDLGGQPVRLPDAWCCYAPVENFPTVGPLPAARNGSVTFGSLNQFGKVHEGLLRCWVRLLQTVPQSRLLIICPEGSAQERTRALFAARAIAPERVELLSPLPWPDYVALFHRIDIALDTFPWNGMTTTCHALWMGVPTVTRTGTTAASRAGSSPLHAVGLSEWVADGEEEYIRIAASWAEDLPRLAELRQNSRSRMAGSPLMDAPRFARNLEAAYRDMWRKWCVRKDPPVP